MLINSKIVIDIATDTIVSRETFEYDGPLALAISGSGGKQSSKQKSEQSSQSGTQFNQPFLDQVFSYFNPKRQTGGGQFDAQKYLQDNPDVANSSYASNPYQHYLEHGKAEGRAMPVTPGEQAYLGPDYNPQYVKSDFTSVAPQGFQRLEDVLFGGESAKLGQAYNTQVGQQREQLAQTGALNDPAQFLEGSARSSLDRTYQQNIQQAARDAAQQRLGAEATEAARRTQYGQAEAGRETQFNEQTQAAMMDKFYKLLQLALESGRFGQSQGWSTGKSSGLTGSGGFISSSGGSGGGGGSWMD